MYDTSLWLGGKEYKSRLIVGTGKYPSFENMREAIEASGAEIVTVAVRRVNLPGQGESLLDYIDTNRYTLLPNTAGRARYPGQARGHRRFANPVSGHHRSARGHPHPRPRGIQRPALCQ
jgi:thiazole synthase ThiGH ThiG subunit